MKVWAIVYSPARKVDNMQVVVKRVGEVGKVQEIENELEVLQNIVGGYINIFPLASTGMLIICNEEGLLQGLEPNIEIGGIVIVGDIVIARQGEEDFESLNEAEIRALRKFGLAE